MLRAARSVLLAPVLIVGLAACGGDDGGTRPPETNSWTLSFDGDDDVVRINHDAALDLTDAITVSVWFYFTGAVDCFPGIVQKDGPDSWGRYGLWMNGNQVEFCLFLEGGQECLTSTAQLQRNTWNHLAGTYDGNAMRLYVNGELDTTLPIVDRITTSTDPIYVGADPGEPGYLPGYINEIRIWSLARTQQQLQDAMQRFLDGDEEGLVLYLKLIEGEGQVLFDSGPNGLTAFLGGGTGEDSGDPVWTGVNAPF